MAKVFDKISKPPYPLKQKRASLLSLKRLQDAVVKLSDLKTIPSPLKTKEIITLLIYQVQRNKRRLQPPTAIHLHFVDKNDQELMILKIGSTQHK